MFPDKFKLLNKTRRTNGIQSDLKSIGAQYSVIYSGYLSESIETMPIMFRL
jgi:hypothetical protein